MVSGGDFFRGAGNNSFAAGFSNSAWGTSSVSFGSGVAARANFSMATGAGMISRSVNSFVAGIYNDTTNTNRLFEIGNGTAHNARSNALTVLANGNVGIATPAPSEKLHVVGNILASGTITPSDERYKKNIHIIPQAIEKLRQLNGVVYDLRCEEFPDMQFDTKEQIGLIAQNVETVLPNIVHTGTDGYKGVDYAKLVPLLIEAIKEQQVEIEKLKRRLFD